MNGVEGVLALLAVEPALLAEAPADAQAAAIEHRTHDEDHSCLRCGNRANLAYIAPTGIGLRWIDLCHGCWRWVRTSVTP